MDHPSFSTQKKLPALRVTLPLLKEIEGYLKLQESKLGLDASTPGPGPQLLIRIADEDGVEQFASAEDYQRDKFTDSTRTVVMEFNTALLNNRGVLRVTIHFVPARGLAKITVKAQMPDARERAINIRDGIYRVTQHYRTLHGIYGPPVWALVVLLVLGGLSSQVALDSSYGTHFRSMARAVTLFAWSWALLGTALRPYIDFECAASKRSDDIWKWAVGIVLTSSGGLAFYGFKGVLG